MISRFVQFKKLSQNDIKILQKYVLKSDAKIMKKTLKIDPKMELKSMKMDPHFSGLHTNKPGWCKIDPRAPKMKHLGAKKEPHSPNRKIQGNYRCIKKSQGNCKGIDVAPAGPALPCARRPD